MARPNVFAPVAQGGDWHRNAVVGRHGDAMIAVGFAEAADLLVEHWRTRGPNDLLFEPIVFNHRHALELILKAAIRASAARLRADGDDDPKLGRSEIDAWLANEARHNLHKLATRLDSQLTRLGEDSLPAQTHGALLSIHELDPSGETFRYATVKASDGTFVDAPRPLLSKPDDLQARVDVVAMHQHFRSAFSLLSGGVMTVLELIGDAQAEAAREAGW